jgi:hypothetical protein
MNTLAKYLPLSCYIDVKKSVDVQKDSKSSSTHGPVERSSAAFARWQSFLSDGRFHFETKLTKSHKVQTSRFYVEHTYERH